MFNKKMKKSFALILAALTFCSAVTLCFPKSAAASETEDVSVPKVTLRICNWEEYIDTGDWDEEETIDLESGDIIGENSVIEDFEEWYLETYGIKVNVEYSTFGTNEDLYNQLTLGDVYDLICPSEYMFMKLISEDKLSALSDEFFDTSDPNNYYINGVSSYIQGIFEENKINGHSWSEYAAGFMWGVTGWVYNPEYVTKEEASSWRLMSNDKFERQLTVKDSYRETYFSAVGAVKADEITTEEFLSDPDYKENLKAAMNDTSPETVQRVQDYLQENVSNFYSFEVDSGKADMITGKVKANFQWSGDAVYTLDQAEEDDVYLCFQAPEEVCNIYFDGWVMLKSGISQDPMKQHAAEAWINFCSRPDIAIRNMYYIGYTSVISGGDDDRIFEYLEWNYAAEDEEEDVVDYDLDYFFAEDEECDEYILTVSADQLDRQLGAQYPSQEVISRSSIMVFFDEEANRNISQMWINVRCFNIKNVPVWAWVLLVLAVGAIGGLIYRSKKEKTYS